MVESAAYRLACGIAPASAIARRQETRQAPDERIAGPGGIDRRHFERRYVPVTLGARAQRTIGAERHDRPGADLPPAGGDGAQARASSRFRTGIPASISASVSFGIT